MKQKSIVMTVLLAAGAVLAAPSDFPGGKFTGTADWRGPGGSTGTYTVEKSFTGTTITSRYAWTEPQPREEKITLTFAMTDASPVFDVLDEQKKVVGQGHCYDDACAYRATFGPVTVEESFRWSADGITVLGAKSGPGFAVVWREKLRSR